MDALVGEPSYSPIALNGAGANANVAKIAIDQRKKKTDVVEPRVISEELLIEGVEEPVKPDAGTWESIEFPNVTSLRLSFLNIIEISNLCNFDALTHLRLDNNIIDKIANLNHLHNLMWLDLSFNNIKQIEGLDQLHNLLDLSLYHNQIEEITGLDGCPNLNILSLGHNHIEDLKQIDNLRKFKNLRCVCLDGNTVCNNDSYNQHVLAYLPHLKYLDYMLIDTKAIAQATEGYNLDELTEVREREQQEVTRQRQMKDKQAIIEKLKLSFLDITEDLFEDLFSKEVEPEHVTHLACYASLREVFRENLDVDIKALRTSMEAKNDSRLRLKNSFEKAVSAAEKDSEDEAFQMVRHFRSFMKNRLAQIEKDEVAGRREIESIVNTLNEHLVNLESQLMANEVQLQESIEEAAVSFEDKTQELMRGLSEMGSDFFKRLEDHHRVFFNGLIENANNETESFQQNQETALADNDTTKAKFLGQKDEMNQAISNFNEAQGALVSNKDDAMSNAMTNWKNSFFENHRERQYHRNRQRVIDIKKVIDACKEEIEAAREVAEYEDEHAEGDQIFGR